MKKIYTIVLIMNTITALSQQSNLYCGCVESFVDSIEIHNVLAEYIADEKPNKELIILIDYLKQNDTLSVITVLESIDHYEVFYRKPECFFIEDNRIIYVRTEKIPSQNLFFLDRLFFETLTILYFSNDRMNNDYYKRYGKKNELVNTSYKVCWENNSIESVKGILFYAKNIFDPIPMEYTLLNKKIVSKKYVERVLFPDISTPNGVVSGGIGDPRFRVLPYWK